MSGEREKDYNENGANQGNRCKKVGKEGKITTKTMQTVEIVVKKWGKKGRLQRKRCKPWKSL